MRTQIWSLSAAMLITSTAFIFGQPTNGAPGTLKWEFLTGSAVSGCPALGTNGLLYAVTDNLTVFAFDAVTGQRRWKTNLGGLIYGSASCHIGPEGTVYVARYGGVHALNGDTGAEKWNHPFPGGWSPTLAIGPDGTLYVAAGYLYALNPADGTVRWEWHGDFVNGVPILAANGLLFITSGRGKIMAASMVTGQRVWDFTLEDTSLTSAAVGGDGTLYALSEGKLVALDGTTGEQQWLFQTNDWLPYTVLIGSSNSVIVTERFGRAEGK